MQCSNDITAYFIKLKILLHDLTEFRHVTGCTCGGMSIWTGFQDQEYVLRF